jgi:2-hydroxy-3-keto-5-methylthiopentenyl-1-phosphate phosphatase
MNPVSYLIELFSETQSPILFVDFDGTVSNRDVIDAVLEEFADDRWLEIEEKWVSGKIGSRECLQKQFALLRAAPDKLNDFIDSLEIDEGFVPLLKVCRDANVPVHIVSDGFDYYIRRLLNKSIDCASLLGNIGIWANRLAPVGENQWRTEFPYYRRLCADGCATCKPEVMRRHNTFASPAIFIGDGLSDRFAAQTADIVFAKKKLADFCAQNGIRFSAYANLKQVAESLDQAFESFVVDVFENRFALKTA